MQLQACLICSRRFRAVGIVDFQRHLASAVHCTVTDCGLSPGLRLGGRGPNGPRPLWGAFPPLSLLPGVAGGSPPGGVKRLETPPPLHALVPLPPRGWEPYAAECPPLGGHSASAPSLVPGLSSPASSDVGGSWHQARGAGQLERWPSITDKLGVPVDFSSAPLSGVVGTINGASPLGWVFQVWGNPRGRAKYSISPAISTSPRPTKPRPHWGGRPSRTRQAQCRRPNRGEGHWPSLRLCPQLKCS